MNESKLRKIVVTYTPYYKGYFHGFFNEDTLSGIREIVALFETEKGEMIKCDPKYIVFKDWA